MMKVLCIAVSVVIAAVLLVASLDLLFHKYPDKIQVELKSDNPAIESKVTEIASKFICSCGTCNEKSLEVCTCPIAVEERKVVREALEESKLTVNEIIDIVNQKFGGRKI